MLRVSRMSSGEPEIFRSIQGEGASAGTPTVFLRLATCNLACTWCDTKYTWDWANFSYDDEVSALPTDDVERRIAEFDLPHLVITGGEPMLQQRELAPLAQSLVGRGFAIEVETNGTVAPGQAMSDAVSQWNVSPKTASSGNPSDRREVADALRAFRDHGNAYFKFVVVEKRDVDDVSALVERYELPAERVILMPEGTTASVLRERGQWLAERCAGLGYRYSTRLHILLWGDQRGR